MKQPADVKPATSPAMPNLTASQMRIAQLFAAMDDRRQQEAIAKMERMATHYPRRTRPALHLVHGGDV